VIISQKQKIKSKKYRFMLPFIFEFLLFNFFETIKFTNNG
jgi:hypothetical protein